MKTTISETRIGLRKTGYSRGKISEVENRVIEITQTEIFYQYLWNIF